MPLFSVSDKQPLIRIPSTHPSHRYHGHVGYDTDDENKHNDTQDYESDDYDSYDGYSYIWGYENGFADGTDSAEQDIEEARQSGYEQGLKMDIILPMTMTMMITMITMTMTTMTINSIKNRHPTIRRQTGSLWRLPV